MICFFESHEGEAQFDWSAMPFVDATAQYYVALPVVIYEANLKVGSKNT